MQSINKFTEVSATYKGKFPFTDSSVCHVNCSPSHHAVPQPHHVRDMEHRYFTHPLTVKTMTAHTTPGPQYMGFSICFASPPSVTRTFFSPTGSYPQHNQNRYIRWTRNLMQLFYSAREVISRTLSRPGFKGMLSPVTYSFKSYSRKGLGGEGQVFFHIYLISPDYY